MTGFSSLQGKSSNHRTRPEEGISSPRSRSRSRQPRVGGCVPPETERTAPRRQAPRRPLNGRSRRRRPSPRADPLPAALPAPRPPRARVPAAASRPARSPPARASERRPPRSSPAHHSRLHPGAACAVEEPPPPSPPPPRPPSPGICHRCRGTIASGASRRLPRASPGRHATRETSRRPPPLLSHGAEGRPCWQGAAALRRAGGDTGLRSARRSRPQRPCWGRGQRLASLALSKSRPSRPGLPPEGRAAVSRAAPQAATAAFPQREPPGRATGAARPGRPRRPPGAAGGRESLRGPSSSGAELRRVEPPPRLWWARLEREGTAWPALPSAERGGVVGVVSKIHPAVGVTAVFSTFPVPLFGSYGTSSSHIHQRKSRPYKQKTHRPERRFWIRFKPIHFRREDWRARSPWRSPLSSAR